MQLLDHMLFCTGQHGSNDVLQRTKNHLQLFVERLGHDTASMKTRRRSLYATYPIGTT